MAPEAFSTPARELNQLPYILFNVPGRRGIQFHLFLEKRRIVAEVDADVALLLIRALVEQWAEPCDSHQPRPRTQRGSRPGLASPFTEPEAGASEPGDFSSSHKFQPI